MTAPPTFVLDSVTAGPDAPILRNALVPQIVTTNAVGIVFLPDAMVTLILVGTDPTDAVLVQVSVMYPTPGWSST